ncbi:MAG: 30S ribosomal protein S20 [Elusimicrobiota bacterium]|jgi:small subunit ribosomal protein S20|nr:30S ribosomal protein S20 [Elusimicrobiota bacterium]
MSKLKTGRHTSAIKEVRKTTKRTAKNASIKSEMKTYVKKLETAVKNKDFKNIPELLSIAFSKWDRAAKRNIIHSKTADNQKARLSKLVVGIQPS